MQNQTSVSSSAYRLQVEDLQRMWATYPLMVRHGSVFLIAFAGLIPILLLLAMQRPFAVTVAIVIVLVKLLKGFHAQRPNWRLYDFESMEPVRHIARDGYLEIASESSVVIRRWNQIKQVYVRSGDIIFEVTRYLRMILPSRAFAGDADRNAFFAKAREAIESRSNNESADLPKIVLNPEPVSLKYRVSSWWFAQQQNLVNRVLSRKPLSFYWAAGLIVLPFVFGVSLTFSIFGRQALGGDAMLQEMIAIVVFVIFYGVMQYVCAIVFRKILAGPDLTDELEVSVDLDETGLEVAIPDTIFFYEWSRISSASILPNRDLAIMSVAGVCMVLIPGNAFADERHFAEFVQRVQFWTQPDSFGHATPNAPPSVETGNPYQS